MTINGDILILCVAALWVFVNWFGLYRLSAYYEKLANDRAGSELSALDDALREMRENFQSAQDVIGKELNPILSKAANALSNLLNG